MKIMICLSFLAMAATVLTISPPIYDYAYHITFDEAVLINKTVYRVNGQTFYDPKNNRERMDRANGRYDEFCGSVLPNVTTVCQQYTVDNKRWLIYPQRSQCCFCCDSAHGCGILRPDWLFDAEYKGQDKILDTQYDKWTKGGASLWVTVDEQIPRRLDEGDSHITDFNVHSFQNQTIPFPDSTFALPSYCNVTTPVNCPLTSVCGELRNKRKEQ